MDEIGPLRMCRERGDERRNRSQWKYGWNRALRESCVRRFHRDRSIPGHL